MTDNTNLLNGFKAGLYYFAVVFAVGFVLGTIRAFFLAPNVGELTAVLIELPFMLAVSWFACRKIIQAQQREVSFQSQLVMGATAFVLLMCAEAALSITLLGFDLWQHLALYRAPIAQLGLAAQIAFALFPIIQKSLAMRSQP